MASAASPVHDLNEIDFAAEVEQSSIPVFVDFHAVWCGPCKALAPTFDALAETYAGKVKFLKVDIDDNRELAQRLSIRGVPCLLLFQNGQVVERVVGGRHKAYLGGLLDKYVQPPAAAAVKKPAKSYRAFQGDAGLREKVAERVRAHIEAGRIVLHGGNGPASDAEQQRHSLMGAAAETADARGFEDALGIPAAVGRLQEAVHESLVRMIIEHEEMRFRLDPPHDVLPVQWWLAIPPGADLQSLPSHFIQWLLRDLVGGANRYGLDLSGAAGAALASLADLHARAARGDMPPPGDWQAVRTSLGALLKSLHDTDAEGSALTAIEQLAWPADELEDALAGVVARIRSIAIHSITPDGYTPEQWAEQKQLATEIGARVQKAIQELFPHGSDPTPEMWESRREELEALEEMKAAKAFSERMEPVFEAHRAKAGLGFGMHLHAGLMQALSATAPPA